MIDHGLSETTVAKIHDVLSKHPEVDSALLLGSRAKGCHKPGSDIDLSLLGTVDRRTLGQIADELDDQLLPYTFSLSIYGQLKDEDFRAHIDRVGVEFYNRNSQESELV